jgi:hypothetical protein
MIKNDQELEATLERIRYFQQQLEKLRQTETNPQNYRLSAGGYLAEINRNEFGSPCILNPAARRNKPSRIEGANEAG